MPASLRISQKVDAATLIPRTRSSPWMRRYPHDSLFGLKRWSHFVSTRQEPLLWTEMSGRGSIVSHLRPGGTGEHAAHRQGPASIGLRHQKTGHTTTNRP